uniref:Uncharacterized protein n=1 Tax=Amphimedon queenslandica TaxID=400682 RepID=A0A1X7STT4_AMPQE
MSHTKQYDSRFDEYVDLSKDDIVEDFDKLIAIVSDIIDQPNCETFPQDKNGCISLDDPILEQPDALAFAEEASDVEADVKIGKMSFKSRVFMSDTASSMLAFKKYPTRDDYANVARTVLKEYPFLKSAPGSGTPYKELESRFKAFQRPKKDANCSNPPTEWKSKTIRKHLGISSYY